MYKIGTVMFDFDRGKCICVEAISGWDHNSITITTKE